MKSNVRTLDFFNRKFVCLCFVFVWVSLTPLGLTAQPFSSTNTSFQAGNLDLSSREGQTGVNQQGLVYSPFLPCSTSSSLSPLGNTPVLYGPGGTPIGGLPLENGSIVLLYLVIAYAIFRLIHTRFGHIIERFLLMYEFFPKRQQT